MGNVSRQTLRKAEAQISIDLYLTEVCGRGSIVSLAGRKREINKSLGAKSCIHTSLHFLGNLQMGL